MKPQLIKEWNEFKKYLHENAWKLLIFNVLLLAVWALWMFDIAPRIDTEVVINSPRTYYNWLDIGRQGAVFTEYFFGLRWYNPAFAVILGYLLICVAGIEFGYIFWRMTKRNAALCSAFGLLCFAAPILAEQFYFELQIFEIAWAYIVCGIAVAATLWSVIRKCKILLATAILCLIWCFSTYQIFVVIYLVMVVTCFILIYQRWTIEEQRDTVLYGRIIARSIIIFVLSFAANSIITKLFFSSGNEYLTGQILWFSQPTKQCVKNVVKHVYEGLVGNSTFYVFFYGLFAVLTVLMVFVSVLRTAKAKLGMIYIAAAIGLQTCPFLLTIAFGGAPAARAQLAYPLVLACDMMIVLSQCKSKSIQKYILYLLIVVAAGTQVNRTMRLVYTDEIRAQEDTHLAAAIEQRIETVSGQNKPVAIIGVYTNNLNASCLQGELVGRSAFNMTSEIQPHYFWSGDRGCRVEQIVGFDLKSASQEQIHEARKQALNMPPWPAQGSVVDAGEYTIVKLSEDEWPEEVMPATMENAVTSMILEDLQVAVDSTAIIDGNLQIKGWFIQTGKSSDCVLPKVYLRKVSTGECWPISTSRVRRPDLVNAFEDGYLYENGGYSALVSLEKLDTSLDNYDLLVGIYDTKNKRYYAVETGYQWPSDIVTESKAKK